MALVIITGHVLATSPPMDRAHPRDRRVAATPRGAVALRRRSSRWPASWFNWGFSLIFSAVLAREVARRVDGVDYRALAAASFLGLGSIWAQGLSGSAALQMATPGALQPQIRDIVAHGGLVPAASSRFTHTIFLWQSLRRVVVEIVVVTARDVAGHAAGAARAQTARDLGHRSRRSALRSTPIRRAGPTRTPGAVARALAAPDLARRRARRAPISFATSRQRGEPLNALNLNIAEPRRSCCSASCCTARPRG